MSKQKFKRGDLVMIAKDLGPGMSHFASDCEAIVLYSYADEYGGSNTEDYGLFIKGKGTSAWYYEHQLTLIERRRHDLLDEWQEAKEEETAQKSDLDWIFANGEEVLSKGYGASAQALASCFGLTNLWGRNGEGFVFYQNAMMTFQVARPFLLSGDKEGWLEDCKKMMESVKA